MDRCRKTITCYARIPILVAIFVVGLLWPTSVKAQSSDFGIWSAVGVEKKINKKWNVGAETEFRTRNDSKTPERWSFGVDGSYKLMRYVKVAAAYSLLYDNNKEKITWNPDGNYNNWRPSYWGVRHRFSFSVTGYVDIGRLKLSLRERWQYTYRPSKITERYDFDNAQWETTEVRGKGRNVLRSRFRVRYDIPHCKLDPYTDIELFNSWSLTKMRYTIGADYKIRKRHVIGLYYRWQNITGDDDDNQPDCHILGMGYTFKF